MSGKEGRREREGVREGGRERERERERGGGGITGSKFFYGFYYKSLLG